MRIIDYLNKLSSEQIKQFKNDYNIEKEIVLDVYSAFTSLLEKKLSQLILDFSNYESIILYYALKKDGFELDSIEHLPFEDLQKALKNLENAGFLYSKKSVQKVRVAIKVFIYEEIKEIIAKRFIIYDKKSLTNEFKNMKGLSINNEILDMPFEMFFYLYSFGGICKKEFLIQQFGEATIQYFIEENALREVILFLDIEEDYQFNICYQLDFSKVKEKKVNVVRSISYHTRIFNDIIRLIYLITKDDILITKKGDINKKHYEKILREIKSENIAWFLIRFFTKHNFIEIDEENNYIYLTKKGNYFFKQDIKSVYEKIINTDLFLKEIYEIIKNINSKEFGIADIVFTYIKDHIEEGLEVFLFRETRRNIIKYIEILSYMGVLIQKYSAEGFVIYSFNSRYKNLVNDESSPSKPLLISPSMEVTVYPNELDLQTSYYLNIFMDIKSFADIFIYQMTPVSIKRAIYFGFNTENLIEILMKRSRNLVPENVNSNLKRWEVQFKSGIISQKTILEASKEVLDVLEHQIEYQGIIIKRLNDNHAIVKNEIYEKRILEEISVYLYSEE